jgi:hypothetical protein
MDAYWFRWALGVSEMTYDFAKLDLITCRKCGYARAMLFGQMEEDGTWNPYIHCKSCFNVYFIDRKSLRE